jgi:hypothetical protein
MINVSGGSESFTLKMEKILHRLLMPKKTGRKPKNQVAKTTAEREK